jgi:hypothetical protein
MPGLREVWHDAHWRVFAVQGFTPLAGGGARVTRIDSDTVDLEVPRPGRYALRVRFTPYWRADQPGACVGPAGDWTQVTAARAGHLRLSARFALSRVRATSPRCTIG